MRWIVLFCLAAVAAGCQREAPEGAGAPGDTTAATPGGGTGAGRDGPASETTTMEGPSTTATTVEATGAPSPPGGYAVESRPAGDGQLAVIEYASPKTVREVGEFYDSQIRSARRVELETAGDNLFVYGLSTRTTIGASTTPMDVERLLGERSEPMVVVGPWKMQRNDPLIRDLRDAGLNADADALLNTKSKVTVIYAVR